MSINQNINYNQQLYAGGGQINNQLLYSGGGTFPGSQNWPPTNPPATRQDSLDIYNNSREVEEYFKDYEVVSNINVKNMPSNPTDVLDFYLKNYSPNSLHTPQGVRDVPLSEYRQKIDENKFKQRDMNYVILDTDAPMSLFDRRIMPQSMRNLKNVDHSSPMHEDYVHNYMYDPIAVAPWDTLSDADKKKRVALYGTSGTPLQEKRTPIEMEKMEKLNRSNMPEQKLQGKVNNNRIVKKRDMYHKDPYSHGTISTWEDDNNNRRLQFNYYDEEEKQEVKRRADRLELRKKSQKNKTQPEFAGGGYVNNQNMNYNQQNYAGGGQVGSVMQGAMAGAGAGAALGPWGMVGGAVLGGAASFLQSNQQPQQTTQMNPQGLGSQAVSFAGGGQMGGQTSNGMTTIGGYEHGEDGKQGTHINAQVIAEKGEEIGDLEGQGKVIFTNQVKPKGSKITYADEVRKLKKKYSMRTADALSKTSFDKELAALFESQQNNPKAQKLQQEAQMKAQMEQQMSQEMQMQEQMQMQGQMGGQMEGQMQGQGPMMASGGGRMMYAGGGNPNTPVQHLLSILNLIGDDGSVSNDRVGSQITPNGIPDGRAVASFALKNYAAQKNACQAGDGKTCVTVKQMLADEPNLEQEFTNHLESFQREEFENHAGDTYNFNYPENTLGSGSYEQLPGLNTPGGGLEMPSYNGNLNQPQVWQPIQGQSPQSITNQVKQPGLQGQQQTLSPAPNTISQRNPHQGNITTGTGGRGSIVNNDSTIPIDPSKSSPGMYRAYKGQGQQSQQRQQGPIDFNAGNNFPYTDANTGLVNNVPQGGMGGQNGYNALPTDQNLGSYMPGALMQSIGPAAQLAGTLIGGPDKTEFDRVNPRYVNPQESINTAERQGALASANMNRSVARGSRTAGQLMGNTVAGNASIGNNMANTVGGLRQNANNMNTNIYNQANAQNAGIQQQEYIANEQNRASYRQSIYGGLTDIGNIGAGTRRDKRMDLAQEMQNNKIVNTLNTSGFNYTYNEDGTISYNH